MPREMEPAVEWRRRHTGEGVPRPPLSRGGSVVVLQHASEPLPRQNAPVADGWSRYRYDQLIAQALMVPFVMIMLDEFVDSAPERRFTDENHPVQAGLP